MVPFRFSGKKDRKEKDSEAKLTLTIKYEFIYQFSLFLGGGGGFNKWGRPTISSYYWKLEFSLQLNNLVSHNLDVPNVGFFKLWYCTWETAMASTSAC